MKETFLSAEVHNRFSQLPPYEKTPASMVRLAVEVTRELLRTQPEAVDEYLRLCAAQKRSIN